MSSQIPTHQIIHIAWQDGRRVKTVHCKGSKEEMQRYYKTKIQGKPDWANYYITRRI